MKDPYYVGRVESKIQERIWDQHDDADVDIAYPHQHLVFDETSGTANVEVTGTERRSRPEEFDAPE